MKNFLNVGEQEKIELRALIQITYIQIFSPIKIILYPEVGTFVWSFVNFKHLSSISYMGTFKLFNPFMKIIPVGYDNHGISNMS